MQLVLLAAGVVLAALGLWIALAPGILAGWPKAIAGPQRRLWGVGKVSWGSALIWASAASTTPLLPQILGGIEVVKGMLLLVVPAERLSRWVTGCLGASRAMHRIGGLIALMLGAWLCSTLAAR